MPPKCADSVTVNALVLPSPQSTLVISKIPASLSQTPLSCRRTFCHQWHWAQPQLCDLNLCSTDCTEICVTFKILRKAPGVLGQHQKRFEQDCQADAAEEGSYVYAERSFLLYIGFWFMLVPCSRNSSNGRLTGPTPVDNYM